MSERAVCYTCDKPQFQCICASIPKVPNQTRVVLLQHPRERRHPVGSARLARLGLNNLHFEVCWNLAASEQAQAIAAQGRCGILFPAKGATPLDGPLPELDNLFVLDGTWTQACGLMKANPWMQNVPHYSVTPDGVDRYRIRREPKAEYTSTIEAIVTALQILEPQTPKLDELIQAFTTLIDRQVNSITEQRRGSRRRLRPHVAHGAIPQEFIDAANNMVVVYPEFTYQRVPYVPVKRSLVYWTAFHLQSREVFSAVVKPTSLHPTEAHLEHIGLPPELLANGISNAELRERWRAFWPAGTHVAGWNQASLDLLRQELSSEGSTWLLKALFCNQQRGQAGHLEDVIATQAVDAPPIAGLVGRAAQRLGNAVAIAEALAKL